MRSTFTKLVVHCSKTCIFYRNIQTIVELQLWNVSAFKEEAHRTMRSIHKGLQRVGLVVVHWLSCVWLCDPVDWSMPGFLVLHHLTEFAQIHVHWVSDAIQSFHPLLPLHLYPSSFPVLGSFPVSQLFTSGDQSITASASASVLPVNIQDWFPLGLTGLISLLSKGLLRVFSSTTVQKHQFFGTQISLWSNSYIHTWLLEKP